MDARNDSIQSSPTQRQPTTYIYPLRSLLPKKTRRATAVNPHIGLEQAASAGKASRAHAQGSGMRATSPVGQTTARPPVPGVVPLTSTERGSVLTFARPDGNGGVARWDSGELAPGDTRASIPTSRTERRSSLKDSRERRSSGAPSAYDPRSPLTAHRGLPEIVTEGSYLRSHIESSGGRIGASHAFDHLASTATTHSTPSTGSVGSTTSPVVTPMLQSSQAEVDSSSVLNLEGSPRMQPTQVGARATLFAQD
jgi:hypothetical protein